MSTPEYERQRRYIKNQKSKGLGKVCVWVPEDKRAELIAYAEKLSEDSKRERA